MFCFSCISSSLGSRFQRRCLLFRFGFFHRLDFSFCFRFFYRLGFNGFRLFLRFGLRFFYRRGRTESGKWLKWRERLASEACIDFFFKRIIYLIFRNITQVIFFGIHGLQNGRLRGSRLGRSLRFGSRSERIIFRESIEILVTGSYGIENLFIGKRRIFERCCIFHRLGKCIVLFA